VLRALAGAGTSLGWSSGCTGPFQQQPQPQCRRCLHASARVAAPLPPGGDAATASALLLGAASPIEALAPSGFNPVLFGTSVWEVVHAATGLPWWASIPVTTLALRAALLPLTLKARGATVNFALMQQASAASRVLWERMQQEQAAAATTAASSSDAGGSRSPGGKAVTRRQLTRQYLNYMRNHHGTPSLWWYTANAFVQVSSGSGGEPTPSSRAAAA
jgi:hypothetical protein